MKHICYLLLGVILASISSGCEIHDDVTVSVKHKAAVFFRYHYDNGEIATLRDIRSMRMFIYRDDKLYRDTLLPLHNVLAEGFLTQTYLMRGKYTFVSWANISDSTEVTPAPLDVASLALHPASADCLMYGKFETPIVKGDSLYFDIDLFKSVFKINVLVTGLEKTPYPEDHFFGIYNRESLDFFNRPSGAMKLYHPDLTYDNGHLSGSFYTPYFNPGEDLTLGVYCDHPESQYTRLCETTISNFADVVQEKLGHDVEIDIKIEVRDADIKITVADWETVITQDAHLGD